MRKVRPGWYTFEVVGFEESFTKRIEELKIDVSRKGLDWIVSTRESVHLRQEDRFVGSFCTHKGAAAFAKDYAAYMKDDSGDTPRPRPWNYE